MYRFGILLRGDYVRAKSQTFISMSWFQDSLEKNHIDKENISNIEFKLGIYGDKKFDEDYFFNGMVKVTP